MVNFGPRTGSDPIEVTSSDSWRELDLLRSLQLVGDAYVLEGVLCNLSERWDKTRTQRLFGQWCAGLGGNIMQCIWQWPRIMHAGPQIMLALWNICGGSHWRVGRAAATLCFRLSLPGCFEIDPFFLFIYEPAWTKSEIDGHHTYLFDEYRQCCLVTQRGETKRRHCFKSVFCEVVVTPVGPAHSCHSTALSRNTEYKSLLLRIIHK